MNALLKSLNGVQSRALSKRVVEVKKNIYYPVLLNCSTYALNKSRSKFVSVGLSSHAPFAPLVGIHGLKNDWVIFNEVEWRLLLENQGIISNFVYTDEGQQQCFNIGTKALRFHTIASTRVVTFSDASEVCLAFESLCDLWDFIPMVESRIQLLTALQFHQFYSSLVKGVVGLPGDYKTHMQTVLNELQGSENAVCMYELLKRAPHVIDADFEINHQHVDGIQGGGCGL